MTKSKGTGSKSLKLKMINSKNDFLVPTNGVNIFNY